MESGPSQGRPPVRPSDDLRPASRPRLPLPPVPAASRAPVPPRAPSAPRTSAAPFRESRADLVVDDAPLDRPARMSGGPADAVRPARARHDAEALVSTGPNRPGGPLLSGPPPRVPRQTTAAGSSSPAYGDWTKPSRAGDSVFATDSDVYDTAGELRLPSAAGTYAPGTTAIPERSVAGRRRREAGDLTDDAPISRGPGTGPVVGGRAAMRAERQAADAVRRKAAKRSGAPEPVGLDPDDDGERRKPRRVLQGLVAMTVVALGVLGVYSFVSPETQETGSQSVAGASTTPALAPQTDALPALPTAPVVVEPAAPVAPVRVPITVLNSTEINGLAAKVATSFGTSGWEAPATGAYTAGDVAASTVFFTEGDETQRQAAVQLVDQFPQLEGPAQRFFPLPPDVAAPGLVVVLTGDWQP